MWQRAIGLCLSLLGCNRAPAFPVTWELGAHASLRGAKVAVRELTARSRRTEVARTPEVTLQLIIDSAEVEASHQRGLAPVRVELSPTSVRPGRRVRVLQVGPLELAENPPGFFQRSELAIVDANGDETDRMQIAVAGTGPPSVAPLRPFGT